MFQPEPLMTVNHFCFCYRHGDEYCPRCSYDFRATNNYVIMDELDEEVAESLSDDRQSINAYNAGAIKTANKEQFKCGSHGTVDCEKCFDWGKILAGEVQEAEGTARWLAKRERYYRNRDD